MIVESIGLEARRAIAVTIAISTWVILVLLSPLLLVDGEPDSVGERMNGLPMVCHDRLLLASGSAGDSADPVFSVDALDAESSTFFVCPMGGMRAADYPALAIDINDIAPHFVVMLAWRQAGESEPHFLRLHRANGKRQVYWLASQSEWRGDIVESAVYLYPHQPGGARQWQLESPISIETYEFVGDRYSTRLTAMGASWLSGDTFSHRTINTLGDEPEVIQAPGFSLNVALIVLWLLIFASLKLVPSRSNSWVRSALLAGLLPGLVITIVWCGWLTRQAADTNTIFRALPADDRLTAQYDGALIELARQAQAVTPDDGRLFIHASATLKALRAAYHARPAAAFHHLPPVGQLRPGDHILIHDGESLLAEVRRTGQLTIGGRVVSVAVVVAGDRGSAVLKVVAP